MYNFFSELSKTINSGQSHSVVLTGNTQDLFFNGKDYVPLVDFLSIKYEIPGVAKIVYELNGDFRYNSALGDVWKNLFPKKADKDLEEIIKECKENQTVALEFMRQLSLKSKDKIIMIVESAEMLIPDGPIANLSAADRKRVSIVQDWLSDPNFTNSHHALILICESKAQLHKNVANLPQLLSINISSPSKGDREHFVQYFEQGNPKSISFSFNSVCNMTAGLSIQAMHQLVSDMTYSGETTNPDKIITKVEAFIQSQLGEDVVEFKRPSHTLKDVVGFSQLKTFINEELIPRFKANDESCLSGAAIAGPIGVGKTFIFEAMATALDMPVLVIKNIRSQWFGQTDIIFERLRRVLEALDKVVIFVDEADTQFGKIGSDAHETERRLTGKFQQMMSDTKLKGKVIWLLMTARIWMLSADIRRPGRVGDLIIPVLDPIENQDIFDFIKWMLPKELALNDDELKDLSDMAKKRNLSAAAFSSLRSRFRAEKANSFETIKNIIEDTLNPDIEDVRLYQTYQALINCTRKSLLPLNITTVENQREYWFKEIQRLEIKLQGKI